MNGTYGVTMLVELSNIANAFIEYIESLSSFYQSIIGSFVFTVSVFMVRFMIRFLLSFSKVTGECAVEFWGKSRLTKHYLHKNMVKSTEKLYLLVFGNFIMLQQFLNQEEF